jgi:hypothetical protein
MSQLIDTVLSHDNDLRARSVKAQVVTCDGPAPGVPTATVGRRERSALAFSA